MCEITRCVINSELKVLRHFTIVTDNLGENKEGMLENYREIDTTYI